MIILPQETAEQGHNLFTRIIRSASNANDHLMDPLCTQVYDYTDRTICNQWDHGKCYTLLLKIILFTKLYHQLFSFPVWGSPWRKAPERESLKHLQRESSKWSALNMYTNESLTQCGESTTFRQIVETIVKFRSKKYWEKFNLIFFIFYLCNYRDDTLSSKIEIAYTYETINKSQIFFWKKKKKEIPRRRIEPNEFKNLEVGNLYIELCLYIYM